MLGSAIISFLSSGQCHGGCGGRLLLGWVGLLVVWGFELVLIVVLSFWGCCCCFDWLVHFLNIIVSLGQGEERKKPLA